MKQRKILVLAALVLSTMGLPLQAQNGAYWQQAANYTIEATLNPDNHQYQGSQTIEYTNNSPDTLQRAFFHLYNNAFQPGSMMDVRSRSIADPDRRVGSRIEKLGPKEIGYMHVTELKQDGAAVTMQEVGTILEVQLAQPILPGASTTFALQFEAQVPVQIRRSGRNNAEGIDYSMAQWYPKLCEYDIEGWHPNPYIAREFHGIWGNFDVKLTLPSKYVVGATGILQNPEECGHGYTTKKVKHKKNKPLTWHFKAENVIDFMWAADPDYVHDIVEGPNGTKIHFFYQDEIDSVARNWKALQPLTVNAMEYINKNFGVYPYKKYSVIQGGDGGMEYPMGTLITGRRTLKSLAGVTVHELLHSWYQMMLATNEAKYAWMDEGSVSYATTYTMNQIMGGTPEGLKQSLQGNYNYQRYITKIGLEEPLTTHADHFDRNGIYSFAAYTKGAMVLQHLDYIMGHETMLAGMRRYFYTWRFKHPTPTEFKRIMEKQSGLELDWFFEHYVGTTNTIDYAVKSVSQNSNTGTVELERIGRMPMPNEVLVTYTDGSQELYYIPLRMMRGEKQEVGSVKRIVAKDWPWTHPTYTLEFNTNNRTIEQVQLDPEQGMADNDLKNNTASPK